MARAAASGARNCAAASLLLAAAFTSASAHAQTKEELDRARAEFREGLALQTAGNCAAAIEKFESVGRVKMTPHVQFNLGLCEEKLGRLVTALGHYQLALADAEEKRIEEVAAPSRNAIQALESRIPQLTIKRGPGADGAVIELDGTALGDPAIGSPMRRDPGSHLVTARLGERTIFQQGFDLAEGATKEIVVANEQPVSPAHAASPLETNYHYQAPNERTGQRTLAYVAGGIGAAGLLTAGVFLVLRQGTINDLDRMCNGTTCPPGAQSTIDRGRLYTGIAEGGVVVGALGLATGTVLIFGDSGKSSKAAQGRQVRVAATPAGVLISGRY